MTDKEILERIVELNGRCQDCDDIICDSCPLRSGSCVGNIAVAKRAKQKQKDMESE